VNCLLGIDEPHDYLRAPILPMRVLDMFSEAENEACRRIIALAIEEDLGAVGDITSQAVVPESAKGRAIFTARALGVLAGLPALHLVASSVDPLLSVEALKDDGDLLAKGDAIGEIRGPMRGILAAERIALNFLQHLSGVATFTRRYVDAVAGLNCKILDTRKTTPGWRLMEKYAVRQGGGHNHRKGLYDGILIKDNHVAALKEKASPIRAAVEAARRHAPSVPIEIEVENFEQFDEALALASDIILLDNMTPGELAEAVARRDSQCDEMAWIFLEASGGITLANVRAVAETGVDRVSIGALTHSAPALDIALDYVS
jgi:nicotinate-nucleotide pyrophosphorylase (carboxylating)